MADNISSKSPAKCPWCGCKSIGEVGDRNFQCRGCFRIWDNIDDGEVGYGPPDRRINREERKQLQQRPKIGMGIGGGIHRKSRR